MMSSKRKSRRSKNVVKYSDSNSNNESDDDFKVEFQPRSKKARTKEVIKRDAVKQGKSASSPKRRLSVEEKLYQRNIEKALEISLSNSVQNNGEQYDSIVKTKNKKPPIEDSDYEPELETVYESEEVEENDDSDISEEKVRRTEKKTNGKQSFSNSKEMEDSDYEPGQGTAAYQSEDDKERGDSDFSEEEVRRKTEKMTNDKQSFSRSKEMGTGNKKQAFVVKQTEKKLLSEMSASITKTTTANTKTGKRLSITNCSGSPAVNRSLDLGGVIIKNPGPPIRVGLSRNMKVKPLHSKVFVSF